jgi:DNA-binding NtrC family response regulator
MPDTGSEPGRGTILLVDTRVAALRRTGDLLRRVGHDLIEAASFDDAKRLLAARRPALVISSLRLAAFNGLHLVHLGRLAQPDINAIIISSGADAVLQREAERVGASLLVEPVPTPAFLSLIARMVVPAVTLAEGDLAPPLTTDGDSSGASPAPGEGSSSGETSVIGRKALPAGAS